MRKWFLLLIIIAHSVGAQNQVSPSILTLEDAVKIALENNYDIRIAKNELKVDQTNVSWGNAGALPSLNATVTDNNSINNSSQVRMDGTKNELDNARNSSFSYGVNLGWTVFDGLGMFARYDRLKELERLGEVELQTMVNDRIAQVITQYYDILQQQQLVSALDSTLRISDQRVTLAQNRYTIGKASKLEVLNARVDWNTDKTALMRQMETLAQSKIQMNVLLARDTKTEFQVVETVVENEPLLLPELESQALKQNPRLMQTLVARRVAELDLKVVKANRMPVVGVTGGYNIAATESSLGFTSSTSNKGWTYGFNASVPIFNGFNQNRNEKVAKIRIENAKLAEEQQNQLILSQLGMAYQTYLTNLGLVELEKSNEELARENLEITQEKYRIGTIPTIEYRTAQLNFLNAKMRHSIAKFNRKVSETELRQLAGLITL